MKLLNCTECHDIVKIYPKNWRKCQCGKSQARYIGERLAEYKGPARILGIDGLAYAKACRDVVTLDEYSRSAIRYEWFVIAEGRNIQKAK